MSTYRRLAVALAASSVLAAHAIAQQIPAAAAAADPDPALVPQRAAAELDDSVPLPDPPLVVASRDGDVVVTPASGDPFFLSFAAGRHYPPPAERIDPSLGNALSGMGSDGRPGEFVYAFIMLNQRMTQARVEPLRALGVRVLGVHPHHSLRVAIPAEIVPVVAALPSVRWVGAARAWQKIHPDLVNRIQKVGSGEQAVYISVFESDLNANSTSSLGVPGTAGGPGEATVDLPPDPASRTHMSHGWMQRALESQGAEIRQYLPRHNVFRARIRPDELARIAGLDFVQFVEADVPPNSLHEESMPLINADFGRVNYSGNPSSYPIVAGIVDSGVDLAHTALDHVKWVGWNEAGAGNTSANTDLCGHGTHVAGTILGDPSSPDSALRGVAPGVSTTIFRRFRNVKWLQDATCNAGPQDIANVVAHFENFYLDAAGNPSYPPVVINNSYGTPGSWIGSEYSARVIDDEVYDFQQVYVFGAGNDGPGAGTINLPGVAKNALTVGSVYTYLASNSEPPGTIASGSSRGPCGDGRWKPNVVAPGASVISVQAGTGNGFVAKSGTSMAAPHVTGAICQFMDFAPSALNQPERIMSVFQASAITKDNALLTAPTDGHLDKYGCGRVDCAKLLKIPATDWTRTNWDIDPTATATSPSYEFADFVVPTGTQRMVVCMSYIEPSAPSGAGVSVVNNWDLFIDQPPVNTTSGNSGEFTAQQSTVDNTEIRILDDPAPGVWRWKAYPTTNFAGLGFGQVRMSVTVMLFTADTTPSGSLTISASDSYVRPGENTTITATAAVNGHLASAVFLDSSVSPVQPSLVGAATYLIDGPTTDLLNNEHYGRDVLLGDILGQSSRKVDWKMYWSSEGSMNFGVKAWSDNFVVPNASVNIVVDGTPPTAPTYVSSPSHPVNVWSKNDDLQLVWPAGTDALAGVDGYSVLVSSNAQNQPDTTLETSGNSFNLTVPTTASGHYVAIRTVDKSGNGSTTYASQGPYKVDTVLPSKVTNLASPSHSINTWSNNKTIQFLWNAASDAHSGLGGYSTLTSQGAPATPTAPTNLGPVTSYSEVLAANAQPYYFNIRAKDVAGNFDDDTVSLGPYRIDTVPPSAVTNLTSPTHPIGVLSTNVNVMLSWTAATDGLSGVEGYDVDWDHSPTTIPLGIPDLATTAVTTPLTASAQDWWVHVRVRDIAQNVGPTVHLGPFRIGVCSTPATSANYGVGKAGTFGIPQLVATTPAVLGGTATVEIQNGLPGAYALLLLGAAATSVPFDQGHLLVAPTLVFTLPVPLSAAGSLALPGDLSLDPAQCGLSIYLQALIPDPGSGGLQHLAMTPGLTLILGS